MYPQTRGSPSAGVPTAAWEQTRCPAHARPLSATNNSIKAHCLLLIWCCSSGIQEQLVKNFCCSCWQQLANEALQQRQTYWHTVSACSRGYTGSATTCPRYELKAIRGLCMHCFSNRTRGSQGFPTATPRRNALTDWGCPWWLAALERCMQQQPCLRRHLTTLVVCKLTAQINTRTHRVTLAYPALPILQAYAVSPRDPWLSAAQQHYQQLQTSSYTATTQQACCSH